MKDGGLELELPERIRSRPDIWTFDADFLTSAKGRVAGADEAGRGSLAGPLVAAAVILGPGCRPDGLNDSKKLSRQKRCQLYAEIIASAEAVSVSLVSARRIDEIGLQAANMGALRSALAGLPMDCDVRLVDCFQLPGEPAVKGIVKGDAKSAAIAAASIVAKESRDRLMKLLDELHPGYGLAEHFGYGTPPHFAALRSLGPSPQHRLSFSGVQ